MNRKVISLVMFQLFALGGLALYGWQVQKKGDAFETEYSRHLENQRRGPSQALVSSPLLLQMQDFINANSPSSDQESSNRLSENPCFEKLVARFYAKVRLRDVQSSLGAGLFTAPAVQTDSLSETTEPKAGWLWDLALESTKGDHNLAQQLIGICSLPRTELRWNEEPELLSTDRQLMLSKVKTASEHLIGAGADADELFNAVKNYLMTPSCPNSSSKMYWPKSLGLEVELENASLVRDKERNAHYENVLHAAYSACLLYQKGLPSPVIEEIQERLRGLQHNDRMCQLLQTALLRSDEIKFDEFDWTSAASQSILRTLADNPEICSSPTDFSPELQPLVTRICPVMRHQYPPESFQAGSVSPEQIKKEMQQIFIDYDSAKLVSLHPQWRLAAACEKSENRSKLGGLLSSATSLRCPRHWSPARCARVIRNLENWVRDDLYQAEQIRVGQRFSRSHCTNLGTETSPLKNACTVVE